MKVRPFTGILISSSINISYLTGFFGFSGEEREAYLFITPKNQYILTDGRYTEAVKKQVSDFNLVEISGKYPAQEVLKEICQREKIKEINIEGCSLTLNEYQKLSKICQKIGKFEGVNRETKTASEIDNIQASCKLGDKALKHVLTKIKPTSTETELASLFEIFLLESGARVSFPTIVAFGENSSKPHHSPTRKKLGQPNGQFLLIDSGVKLNNYCSDMTRTYFWGEADTQKKKIYRSVLDAQEKAVEFLNKKVKNGQKVTGREVDVVARSYIESQGFPAYSHSLGHGIGLEVHESPRLNSESREILKEGMVFSIEPGIYIPGFGGMRIEDLYAIEKDRLKQLTNASKKLTQI